MITAYFQFVLRHRIAILLSCLLVTGAAGYSISRAVVASSIAKMFFGDVAEYKDYQRRVQKFASDEVVLIGYEDAALLSRPSLERLERAVHGLKGIPEVARIQSLLTAQRIRSAGDTLLVESYADAARGRPPPARIADLVRELRADPLLSGLLVGRGGRHAAVIIELKVDPDRRAERIPLLLEEIIAHFVRAGFDPDRLHRSGLPSLMGEIMVQTQVNLRRLLPITLIVLLAVVFALFRRLAPALLAMSISGLSVVWSLGFARLIDRDFNIFLSIVPAVILIVAFSDVIHLWSAFKIEWQGGKDKRASILASASDVGAACLLTSLTTFIGFVCLSAIPTPVFRQLGVVLGFGVAVALLLAMTLVPVALSYLDPPARAAPAAGTAAAPTAPTAMEALLSRISSLATNRPWLVLVAFAALLASSTYGLTGLVIDTALAERFQRDSAYRVDQRYFETNFSGTNMLEVFIEADAPQGLLDPALLARISRLQRRLEARAGVDRAVSLVDLIEKIHRSMGGEGRLPRTRQALAQYLLLFEMSGGEDLEQLVDFERRSMRIAVRLKDHAVRSTYRAGQEANRLGAELVGSPARIKATSLTYLVGWWLDSIVAGQRNGLILSICLIALVMVIGLRSFRVGLGSMVPNLLPLLALGGYLGLTRDLVDSDTLILAMMAIGIGVDDTIHFLMRYRIESGRTADRAEALRRTYAFSGRAIILTTVVLVLGFAPFAASDYYSTQILGTLLPGVLVVALLADLLLVPALVRLGWLAFPGSRAC